LDEVSPEAFVGHLRRTGGNLVLDLQAGRAQDQATDLEFEITIDIDEYRAYEEEQRRLTDEHHADLDGEAEFHARSRETGWPFEDDD
jgi:hypothetical protein